MAFGLLKKWWEQITPQNEEAIRQGQRSIASANQKIQNLGNKSKGVLANQQVRQNFVQQQSQYPKFNIKNAAIGSMPDAARQTGLGIGLGATRLGTSFGQGISGVADLASPGTGTNRFSKKLDTFAKDLDQTAKNEGVNGIYRGAQIVGEPVSFVAGGGAIKWGAKAATQLPKVGKAAQIGGKAVAPVSNVVNKAVTNLNKGGTAAKLTATATKAAVNPANTANMAVDTGYTLGAEASKGRDISKADVALSMGTSGALGIGLPVVARGVGISGNKTAQTGKAIQQNRQKTFERTAIDRDPELHERVTVTRPQLQGQWDKGTPVSRKQTEAAIKLNEQSIKDRMSKFKQDGSISVPGGGRSKPDNGRIDGEPKGLESSNALPEIVPPKATPIDNLNPTGKVFTKYSPSARASAPLGKNISTLDKTAGGSANDLITVYRGAPNNQTKLNAGDFITTNKQLAKDYAGDGRVIETSVRKGDILDDVSEPLGEEYIYKPQPKGVILSGTSKNPNAPQTANVMIKEPGKALRVEQRQINQSTDPSDIGRALGMSDEDIARAGDAPDKQPLSTDEINELNNSRSKEELDQGVLPKENDAVATFDDVYNKHLDIDDSIDPTLSKRSEGTLGAVKVNRDKAGSLNPIRLAEKGVGKGLRKIGESDSRLGNKSRRLAQYLFNKQAGINPDMIDKAHKLAGGKTFADFRSVEMAKKVYELVPDAKSLKRVHSVIAPETLESIPVEQADGTYKQVFENAPKYKDLTPQEQKATDMLREYGDAINDTSYRNGDINKKQWEHNKGGKYMARLYKTIQESPDAAKELGPDFGLFTGLYKSRKAMNDDMKAKLLRDPVKIASIRARQVQHNAAMKDYMQSAEAKGYVSDSPKNGYVKVEDGSSWYNWSGRYVDQAVYEQAHGFKAIGQAMKVTNDALDLWDGFAPRRWRKKMLTVYNPVVRVGNRTSNYFFAYLNGINPVTFADNMIQAKKALKSNDPIVIGMTKAGMLKNNTIVGDRNLFDVNKAFAADLDKVSPTGLGKAKNADQKITETYGGKDDQAKVAAVMTHMERGHSLEDAIAKARRGFQDYSRVGHMYDMAAKSPLFGNAFARFQGDLYMNILKNAAVDHPVRLASLPLGILALGEGLSSLSGESNEDKRTREDRAGAAAIPFSKPLNQAVNKLTDGRFGSDRNISLDFQTPVGAVDVARFTPLYMRQDIDGNSLLDDASRVLPFNIPSTTKAKDVAKEAFSDPLIGPALSTVGDVDWMGKSVKDPDGYRDGKALFPDDPLSKGEEWRNRLQYGIRSYAPYPMNELGDIAAYASGDARNEQAEPGGKNVPDNTGKNFFTREGFNTQGTRKNVTQGLFRLGGVRVQQFGEDAAKEQREKDKMFDYFDKVDEFKETLDSTTRNAFDARHKSTRTRSGINAEFTDDPFWKYKSASELLQNPKLFDAEKSYAQMQNQYDGKPIDPIFDLPTDQRNQILLKKLKMPGAKDEGLNTLYDQDWYADFRKKQDTYYSSKDDYTRRRADEAEKAGNQKLADSFRNSLKEKEGDYPEASAEVQKGIDYYFDLPKGTGARSAFIKGNPGVWKQITDQWDAQDKWNDKEREKLGLPEIPDDDDTFAYGSKGSKGGRKGKKGGKKSKNGYKSIKIAKGEVSDSMVKVAKAKAPASKLRVATVSARKSQPIKIAKAKKIKDVRTKRIA